MLPLPDAMNTPASITRPLVFAHRGASRQCRENTMEAFEAALAAGADGIELDIRRTRDGVLVVHHNARVARNTRRLANLDYDDNLRLAARRGYRIPTIEEVLHLCRGRVQLDIELKETGYESDVVDAVKREFDLAAVAFTSFLDESVLAVKQADPKARTGLIVGLGPPRSLRSGRPVRLSRRIEHSRADCVVPNWKLVTRHFCDRMHRSGLPVYTWTVNRKTVARRLVRLGVRVIITDVPGRILPVVGDEFAGEK